MDIQLLRTFLAVADTGSFGAASARLYVTQSAVSLRVQRLEDQLGRPLFERSKAGARLTPAGAAFERYALSILRSWEEARQQLAVPEGYCEALSIGAEHALWPRLGFRWIDALRAARPTLAVRAELGRADRLTRFLIEGQCQVALTYTPQIRPGLTAAPVLEDELILVAAFPTDGPDDPALRAAYAFCDWGTEFARAHAAALPGLTGTPVTLALGTLAADYASRRHAAAYTPARAARRMLDAGTLHLVPDAPIFPYPIWSVVRDDLDADLARSARETLEAIAREAESVQDEVLGTLDEISEQAVTIMDPVHGADR